MLCRSSTTGSANPSVAEPDIVWMTVGKDRVPVMVFYPELLSSSKPCIPASVIGESLHVCVSTLEADTLIC